MLKHSTLVVAVALFSACSSSHPNDGPTDGGSNQDAHVTGDAGSHDDGGADAGSDGGVCGLASASIQVVAQPGPTSVWTVEECSASPSSPDPMGSTVRSSVAVPGANGIRITIDRCPGADEDCTCEYTVHNVGVDIEFSGIGETLSLALAPNAISLSRTDVCECLGCPCSIAPVFFAADSTINEIPVAHESLDFSVAPASCMSPPDASGNFAVRQPIRLTLGGVSTQTLVADEGETEADDAGQTLRVIRSNEIECPACGGFAASARAWVFWKERGDVATF
ncbi:MAG: hypothetical protein IPK60_07865 [Sandaracinaceae bacterium]|nr:hypothetical protein [Sandaracinaceae bacterium]